MSDVESYAYDSLRATVAADLERERARGYQLLGWLVAGEVVLVGLYGLCLQQLAAISAQEPATYPKENIPVSVLAWFTAWALPMLGLGFSVLTLWFLTTSVLRVQQLIRHWRRHEGLAASHGQRLPADLYPPLRGGGWGLLLVPILFLSLWVSAVRLQSGAIESGIENWRSIPQDQA